jgi:hypothetical protein
MPLVYATVADLEAWLPPRLEVPADAELQLAKASQRLSRVLLTAVYDVGPSGLPTDPEVAQALAEATCAIVEYRLDTGDSGTGGGGWTTVSAGSVSLSRAAADPVTTSAALPESALDVLAALPSTAFRLGVVSTAGAWWW